MNQLTSQLHLCHFLYNLINLLPNLAVLNSSEKVFLWHVIAPGIKTALEGRQAQPQALRPSRCTVVLKVTALYFHGVWVLGSFPQKYLKEALLMICTAINPSQYCNLALATGSHTMT